jgi:FKBP-type peptidyl-prolyl cis-trans isomerase SlyD
MKITKDTVVTLTFAPPTHRASCWKTARTPRSYLHGGYDNTLPGIEKALEGQEKGLPGASRCSLPTPLASATKAW